MRKSTSRSRNDVGHRIVVHSPEVPECERPEECRLSLSSRGSSKQRDHREHDHCGSLAADSETARRGFWERSFPLDQRATSTFAEATRKGLEPARYR
jgi:hypothetical protein